MISATYVAYCLDCDAQLSDVEVNNHNCWEKGE